MRVALANEQNRWSNEPTTGGEVRLFREIFANHAGYF